MQDAASGAGDAIVQQPIGINVQYKHETNTEDTKTSIVTQTDVHHHHHHQDLLKSEAINRTAMVVCENLACGSVPSNNITDNDTDKIDWNKQPMSSTCTNDDSKKEDDNLVDNSDNSSDKDLLNTPPYLLKSGHAKTHSIIINLDENSRFTEEVTV